jgi:hypothetical protein
VCLNAMAGYTAPASQSGDGASSDTAKIIGKRRAVRSSGNAASRFDLRAWSSGFGRSWRELNLLSRWTGIE